MPKMIFVNLPVTDLSAAIAFYKALGFEQNIQFSDDTAACMVWSEAIYMMLLTHAKWRTFTQRPIPPSGSSEVMLALALDTRGAVDAMAEVLDRKIRHCSLPEAIREHFLWGARSTVIAGTLTPEAGAALEEQLLADPEALRRFVAQQRLDAALACVEQQLQTQATGQEIR